MPRSYRPGSRNRDFRRFKKGSYTDERYAWVDTLLGQMVLMVYPEGHEIAENTTEPGPTVKVLLPRHTGPTVHWDITNLTGDELDKLREFFQLVFDTAEPIIRMRDEVAQDANARGDDSFSRLYRQVPRLVVRKGKEREHNEGVLHRSEDVSEGNLNGGPVGGSSRGVLGVGDGMADDVQEQGSAEDD